MNFSDRKTTITCCTMYRFQGYRRTMFIANTTLDIMNLSFENDFFNQRIGE